MNENESKQKADAQAPKKYRCTAHFRCNGGLVGCCVDGQWMIPGCDA